MIAVIFPGQGSQKAGMGQGLRESFPESKEVYDIADSVITDDMSESLSQLIAEDRENKLTLTEYTQPAVLTVSIAAYRALKVRGFQPSWVAGHSLGEYSAHVAAGTLKFNDAVRIVRRRGRYMQEAVPVGQGAMAAILGLDEDTVKRACLDVAGGDVVTPANLNGGGQIVIAGEKKAVHRAVERAKTLGARRAILLPVSAPFHCALMQPAQDRLEPELRALPVSDPLCPVVANVDAQPKHDSKSAIQALVDQVSAPVQWEAVVRRLATEGVTTYVEVGPGTVLSGLIRKIHPEATTLHFGAATDLPNISDVLAS